MVPLELRTTLDHKRSGYVPFVSSHSRVGVCSDNGFRLVGIACPKRFQNFPVLPLSLPQPSCKHVIEKIPVQPIPVIQHFAHQRTNQASSGFFTDKTVEVPIFDIQILVQAVFFSKRQ